MPVRQKLAGQHREAVRTELARLYRGGMTIRVLMSKFGYSYGLTHKLLVEAGVTLRPTGVRPAGKHPPTAEVWVAERELDAPVDV